MFEEFDKKIKTLLGEDYDFVQGGIDKNEYDIEHTDDLTCTITVAWINVKSKTLDTNTLQFEQLPSKTKELVTRALVELLFKGDN